MIVNGTVIYLNNNNNSNNNNNNNTLPVNTTMIINGTVVYLNNAFVSDANASLVDVNSTTVANICLWFCLDDGMMIAAAVTLRPKSGRSTFPPLNSTKLPSSLEAAIREIDHQMHDGDLTEKVCEKKKEKREKKEETRGRKTKRRRTRKRKRKRRRN
jgi:hypothetical protein